MRLNLKITNAQGECYDSAATIYGKKSGVKKQMIFTATEKLLI